jgi:hypothetical protein
MAGNKAFQLLPQAIGKEQHSQSSQCNHDQQRIQGQQAFGTIEADKIGNQADHDQVSACQQSGEGILNRSA